MTVLDTPGDNNTEVRMTEKLLIEREKKVLQQGREDGGEREYSQKGEKKLVSIKHDEHGNGNKK